MSYFMTAAGPGCKLRTAEPAELLPVEQAQDYVRELAPKLIEMDGSPLYLVHDGESGTSHDVVRPGRNRVFSDKSAEETLFASVVRDLLTSGHTIRVWDAGSASDREVLSMELMEFPSAGQMLVTWAHRLLHNQGVRIRTRLTAGSGGDAPRAARA